MRLPLLFMLLLLAATTLGMAAPVVTEEFPKIANLWGWEPGDARYDVWGKYDMLIMSGGPHDEVRKLRREIKARNPRALMLGTAPFQNVEPPSDHSWLKDEWYLRKPNGEKVNWWVGQLYAPNLFAEGYIDGAVNHADFGYGPLIRDGTIDGFMFDSVVGGVTWYGDVDTNLDGAADRPEDVDERWQRRQNVFLDKLRSRFPDAPVVANNVDMRHAPHLNGRVFEGNTLLDLVPAGYASVQETVCTLNAFMHGSRQPGLTFATMSHPIGWQWWRLNTSGRADALSTPGEIDRVKRDYPRMRLGLLMCLMSDAYYCYDFGTTWYGYPMWYAEYDAPLGKALGPAREMFTSDPKPILDWQGSSVTDGLLFTCGTRRLARGIECSIAGKRKDEWSRMLATDPDQVRLEPGKTYRIVMDADITAKSSGYFQCVVRTAKGGLKHDRGARFTDAQTRTPWRVETTVTLGKLDDYSVQIHQCGSGSLLVKQLRIHEVRDSYFVRGFEGGIALLNPTARTITVRLPRAMHRLSDNAAPRYMLEIDDVTTGAPDRRNPEPFLQQYREPGRLRVRCDFEAGDGWETRKEDGHHCGDTCRVAADAGKTASWWFRAPSTDTYTLYTWVSGKDGLTKSARYALHGSGAAADCVIDQSSIKGAWVKLFDARLRAGGKYRVGLVSTGDGLTSADAIRIESAARYNDGAPTSNLTLDPLDGLILLRRPFQQPYR